MFGQFHGLFTAFHEFFPADLPRMVRVGLGGAVDIPAYILRLAARQPFCHWTKQGVSCPVRIYS
ncbi:hypothetical protein [Methylomagnum ishizawai]|uniref:hypothetical protein n=1 Tax=Methylomagnum ishizawai TaxID=1760988 RepID=UPI000A1507BC|nr:hypothetical protein [Methylomagnum ishizawai]